MKSSVADPDPGSAAFSGIRDGKKSGSGSGMNNPDNISKSLETIFWVKILKFFDADPGWEKIGSRFRDGKKSDPGPGWKKFGSGIRNTDEVPPVDLLICGLLLGPRSGRLLLHLGVMGLHVLLQHFSSLRAKQRWNS